MTAQEFAVVDVLRLQVQEGWPDLPNQILNPSGEGGAWGWETFLGGPDATLRASATHDYLELKILADTVGARATWATSIAEVVAVGQQVRAFMDILFLTGLPDGEWSVNFATGPAEDPDAVNLGTVAFPDPLAVGDYELPPTDIPVGTKVIYLNFYTGLGTTTANDLIRWRDTWLIYGDAADVVASDPLTEPPWVDVLGSAASIEVERDELNVSTLTATLFDATLDPASTDLIRPGKRCKVEALVSGVWEPLFTGKLDNPSSAYEVRDPNRSDLRRVQIKLIASDAAADLANEPRPLGVSTLAELPYVLLGTGVPFNVNGSTDAIAPESVIVVANNEQASALDQVAITRDSVLGFAWVDRAGVLQAWDRGELPAGVTLEADEGAYSDVDIDFDVDRTFNTIRVKLQRINPGTLETEEVEFGPYVDQAARRQWRAREATFTVQGMDETLIPAYAAEILALNANPVKRINSLSIPVRTVAEIETYALLDPYDLVSLSNDRAGIVGQESRVTSLKHRIVVKREGRRLTNRWWIDLAFSTEGNVASPTVSPSPTVGGTRTIGQLLRPIGEVSMWFGAKADIPAGWLPCDGTGFDGAQYPVLATLLGASVLPNFTDRFPIGAGTKALGTSGASALAGATAGDWRAVWFIIRAA
jgi:hypothetical protein